MDKSEITKDARTLNLPEEFTWPTEIVEELAEYEKAYQDWSEAQTVLYEKIDALQKAEATDQKALVDAVSAGKSDPGRKATEAANRERVYQEEVVRQARQRVNVLAGKLWARFNDSRLPIIEEACRLAREGVDQFGKDLAEIKRLSSLAVERRAKSLAGLRFVARLDLPEFSFDPSFPIDGSFKVPLTHEKRTLSIVYLLEQVLQSKAA